MSVTINPGPGQCSECKVAEGTFCYHYCSIREDRVDAALEEIDELKRKLAWWENNAHFCDNGKKVRPYAALLCSLCTKHAEPDYGVKDA